MRDIPFRLGAFRGKVLERACKGFLQGALWICLFFSSLFSHRGMLSFPLVSRYQRGFSLFLSFEYTGCCLCYCENPSACFDSIDLRLNCPRKSKGGGALFGIIFGGNKLFGVWWGDEQSQDKLFATILPFSSAPPAFPLLHPTHVFYILTSCSQSISSSWIST